MHVYACMYDAKMCHASPESSGVLHDAFTGIISNVFSARSAAARSMHISMDELMLSSVLLNPELLDLEMFADLLVFKLSCVRSKLYGIISLEFLIRGAQPYLRDLQGLKSFWSIWVNRPTFPAQRVRMHKCFHGIMMCCTDSTGFYVCTNSRCANRYITCQLLRS